MTEIDKWKHFILTQFVASLYIYLYRVADSVYVERGYKGYCEFIQQYLLS